MLILLLQVPFTSLYCTKLQLENIREIHTSKVHLVARIFSDTPSGQQTAQKFLTVHKLDRASLDMLESRWSVAWSDSWGKSIKMCRAVFQW